MLTIFALSQRYQARFAESSVIETICIKKLRFEIWYEEDMLNYYIQFELDAIEVCNREMVKERHG